VLDINGQANGDLVYDDGESLDTIDSQNYYYATFEWSSDKRQLSFNVIENNYAHMSKLILDSLIIYGWNQIPSRTYANNKQIYPIMKPHTQIVYVDELNLAMHKNHLITWNEFINNDN
jgi:hypothetical protein